MRRQGLRPGLGVLVLAAFFGGCAVADQGAFVRLQEEVESVKREVAAVRAAAPSREPAAPPGRADAAEIAALQRSVADLAADADRVKADLLAAGSRAEEARLAFQKELADLTGRVDEQAQVVTELRAASGRVADLERRLAALEEKVDRLASSRPAPAPAAGALPPRGEWKSPEEMYDHALGLVKGGDTRGGRELLAAFAAKYPGHRLLPNAYYWKGEAFYAEKDYENAILAFQDVIDKYPASDKAPDAMLKQGMAFIGLNDRKNARLVLELLVSKHPKSPAAEKARQKLLELK